MAGIETVRRVMSLVADNNNNMALLGNANLLKESAMDSLGKCMYSSIDVSIFESFAWVYTFTILNLRIPPFPTDLAKLSWQNHSESLLALYVCWETDQLWP